MTLPQLTLVESQILVALERRERVAVAVNGWVGCAHVLDVIPGVDWREFDRACRLLVRRGLIELWNPGHPPSGPYQSIRRTQGDG